MPRTYLVLGNVILQLRHVDSRLSHYPLRPRVVVQEVVHDFGKQLMRYQTGIGMVGNKDSTNAFRAAVCVECEICGMGQYPG